MISLKQILVLLFCMLFFFSSCKKYKQVSAKKEANLSELMQLMQGSFSSEAQAKQDSTYFNISLHMVPIWKDKGNFLYVEQALFSKQEKPYRQRIYELKQENDSTIASYVYTIKNDSLWVGKWNNTAAFDSLPTSAIALKLGCAVFLKRHSNNEYRGSTKDQDCKSTLYGATYATSIVTVKKDTVISWDRGFNTEKEQIWGAKNGAYIFTKLIP